MGHYKYLRDDRLEFFKLKDIDLDVHKAQNAPNRICAQKSIPIQSISNSQKNIMY